MQQIRTFEAAKPSAAMLEAVVAALRATYKACSRTGHSVAPPVWRDAVGELGRRRAVSSRTQPGSGLAAIMADWLTRQGVARMAPFGPGLALRRCQPGGQRGGKRAALREQSGGPSECRSYVYLAPGPISE